MNISLICFSLSDGLTFFNSLISTLKSRYLQSPAEVDAWMAGLDQKYEDMVAEVKAAAIASQVPDDSQPVQSTE